MRRALIGYTGFVGGSLARQAEFDSRYNSSNIEEISGGEFEVVACAGAPGAKWKANKDPDGDRASIERLMRALEGVRTDTFVLMSTVDVYGVPHGHDEFSPIDESQVSPYGRHRKLLEDFCVERFNAMVVRLPALFAKGLRKNAVYDLVHDNNVDRIHPGGSFQFYNMDRTWADAHKALDAGIRLLNVATEPVTVGEIAEKLFGRTLAVPEGAKPASYDMRSRHSALWGRSDGYLYGREQMLDEMRAFVESERS